MKLRLWQFRLRTLFALLFLSALSAAWWAHRSHCLERAEYHKEQAKVDHADAVLKELEAEYEAARKNVKELEAEYEAARKKMSADLDRAVRKVMNAEFLPGKSGDSNFFNESIPERDRVAGAISQGYLLALKDEPNSAVRELPLEIPKAKVAVPTRVSAPSPPAEDVAPSAQQQAWAARAKALNARAEFHLRQADRYSRAVYRPWMTFREAAPDLPAEPLANE